MPHTPKPPRNLPSNKTFPLATEEDLTMGETGTQDPGLREGKTQMRKWGKVRVHGAQAGPLLLEALRNLTPRPGPEPGWGVGVNHLLGAGSEGEREESGAGEALFSLASASPKREREKGQREEGWGWWKDPSLCLTLPRSWRLGGEGGMEGTQARPRFLSPAPL